MPSVNSHGIDSLSSLSLTDIGKYLKIGALSLGISLPAAQLAAQTQESINLTLGDNNRYISGMCLPNIDDISQYKVSHIIQPGDTIYGLALSMGIRFSDFSLFFNEFNPDRSIDDVLKLGDEIYILSPEVNQETIDSYRNALEQKQEYENILALWEAGEIDQIKEGLEFHITPALPVNLGLRNAYEALGGMVSQGLRIGSRSVYPEYENQAQCTQAMKNTVKSFLGFTPTPETQGLYELVRAEGQDAWIIGGGLEEVGYERIDNLDLRYLFRKDNFSSATQPILGSENNALYAEGLIRQLEFLRSGDAIGCFIPTLFQYTATRSTVFGMYNGTEPNSHMFVCSGINTSETMALRDIGLENISVNHEAFLVALVKKEGLLSTYKNQSSSSILGGLRQIHNFISLEIMNDQGEFEVVHFDENLNPDREIIFDEQTRFRIGGNVLLDGYQITPSNNYTRNSRGNLVVDKIMEQRLNFDWIIYASHFFNTTIFHPTSILQPSDSILDAAPEGIIGNYSQRVPIGKFLDVNRGEEVNAIYFEQIAQNMFGMSLTLLNDEQQALVQERYQIHSLGLQLLGYHSFGGKAWNDGATNINAPIPFIQIESQDDIDYIKNLYAEYIAEKRAEYYQQLQARCEGDNFQEYPFIRIAVFPGDSKYSIIYQILLQLQKTNPEEARIFSNLSIVEKESIILLLLGENIFQGNLESGYHNLIGYSELSNAINFQKSQSVESPLLLDAQGNISPDAEIIGIIGESPLEEYLLSWSLILESYVDMCENCDEFERNYFWNLIENHLFSRRALKDYVHRAEVLGVQDYFDTQDAEFWSRVPNFLLEKLISKGVLEPSGESYEMIRVSSLSDFQIRVGYNLFNGNALYKQTWPGKYLEEVLNTVLEVNGKYTELFDMYPQHRDQIASDLHILKQVRDIVVSDTDSMRGGDIEELLRSISVLDAGNQSNIVSKVFWGELTRFLDRENSHNIFQKILVSGHDISGVENLGRRFGLALLLDRNLGGEKTLYLWLENYLSRMVSLYDSRISLPRVEVTEGISKQTVYNRSIFLENIEQYRGIIAGLDGLEQQEKQMLLDALAQIDYFYTDSDVLEFFANDDIVQMYNAKNLDSFLIPTVEEFDNTNLFRYTAQRNILEERRVYKPELSSKDIAIPVIVGAIITQIIGSFSAAMLQQFYSLLIHSGSATGELAHNVYKRSREKAKIQRENRNIGTAKRKLNKAIKNINVDDIDAYIAENQARNKSGIGEFRTSHFHGIPLNTEMLDGDYKIGENGIESFTPFQQSGNIVLTNDTSHPEHVNYADGSYQFYDPLTQLVRDAYMSVLMSQENTSTLNSNQQTSGNAQQQQDIFKGYIRQLLAAE